MKDWGALYLVWGERAKARVKDSVASLNAIHPNLPVHVAEFEQAEIAAKSHMSDLSPFENTLYLDADTTILGPLDYAFAKAEQFGLACRLCEVPFARRWRGCGHETLEYNTGVLFFTRRVSGIFWWWKTLAPDLDTAFHHYDGRLTENVDNDQPSFAAAVERSGLHPFVLPANYNFRRSTDQDVIGPVKIWHDWMPPPPGCIEFSRQQESSRHIERRYLREERAEAHA